MVYNTKPSPQLEVTGGIFEFLVGTLLHTDGNASLEDGSRGIVIRLGGSICAINQLYR